MKLSQISNLDESTPKISNPYSNMTYTMKIHNVRYAIYHLMTCNHMILKKKNVAFIDETNIYSPLHIKNIIKEKYKLNNLKAISFAIFIANTTNNQLLQYVGGVVGIAKT